MKRIMSLMLAAVFTAMLLGCSAKASGDPAAVARKFVQDLSSGTASTENFDEAMKKQVPEATLKPAWESVLLKLGKYQSIVETKAVKLDKYDVVHVTTSFENGSLDIVVSMDPEGRIAGLQFVPIAAPQPKTEAGKTFVEKAVTIGSGQWKLPGTLTMPKGNGPFPAMVLVHGSGPNDRDETIYGNKPFKDIAEGLVAKGIAVLRYDKRSYVYGQQMAAVSNLTMMEETVQDAVKAVQLLKLIPGIDAKRIFVLGHSQGGYQIPRIAGLTKDAAGYIIMGGNVSPLEEVILYQNEYMLSLDKSLDEKTKQAQMDMVKAMVANVKTLTKASAKTADQLFGIPAPYWLNLKGYNPAKLAKAIKQPLLVLQGERDFQVTMKEFNLWKKTLTGKTNVTFKSYVGLNHLMITGTGNSTMEEYKTTGHVSQQVIDDIGSFLLKK